MSRRPRRNHTPVFKSKVALAAIKGDKPLARIIHKRWPDRRGTRMNTNFSNSDRKDALRGTEFPANPKNLYRHWTSRRSVAEP
jgi:hypothetical protein